MKGNKLGRQGGSGSQERNHEGREAWKTSLGDKAAAAAKSEIMKGDKLGDKAGAAAKSEITKGEKLGRQAWETRWQRQPGGKS